ncbi:MAG: hypothetical protein LWX56_09725 [Ignavibacteria bacterium]|nr:hypothetical protein [Ignavibacteria bacterium]
MRFTLLLLIVCFIAAYGQSQYSSGYPRWMSNATYRTDQTSGMVYLRTVEGKREFLLVDDIGKIHRFFIEHDTVFTFHSIVLSKAVQEYLKDFPKWDFEEVTYDKYTNKIYMSIEGNKPRIKETVGIYELGFKGGDIFSDTIESIKKVPVKPEATFLEYVEDNIGYEGMAVDENYLYLGLEGFAYNIDFGDSTFLYVADKKDYTIQRKISTKDLGIRTICGMYATGNRQLLIIDRNSRVLHYVAFDKNFAVTEHHKVTLKPAIPGYVQFEYNAALESVTSDEAGNIYLADDPWKSHYKPAAKIFNQLDENTQNNFIRFVPVIYKLEHSILFKEN